MRARFHLPALCIAALTCSPVPAAEAPPALGLSGSGDVSVCRAFIPSAERRHGEVRLVRRGGTASVQTLLYSPALRRGLQKIRQAENAHWPPDRAGYDDSQLYLGVLEKGKAAALDAFAGRADQDDPRQNLLIEVTQDGDRAWVGASLPEYSSGGDDVEIRSVRPVASSPVSADYARAAMENILRSAFHKPDRSLEEFLSGDALRDAPASAEEAGRPVTR